LPELLIKFESAIMEIRIFTARC